MDKIILIKKYTSTSFFWSNLKKKKQIKELSIDQVINKYQGFEGDLLYSSSVFQFNVNKIVKEYIKKDLKKYLLLYIRRNENKIEKIFQKQFHIVGYDFGICENDNTIYSSIFNEILFGKIKEIISYKDFLNDSFLFPSKLIAINYSNFHHELLLQGKDLENDSDMNIYEIWKYKFDEKIW